jgi:hypothetical protein
VTPAPRKRIGRNVSGMTRALIYETADAIEVESREGYEVSRKRVLYEEVLLVTIHRDVGAAYVIALGFMVFLFAGIALTILISSRETVVAAWFGAIAIPFLIPFVIRLVLKVDYVTVFGRRSKAVLRFNFRKRRARETYGRICSRTMEVQRAMVEREPETPAPVHEPAETPPPVGEPPEMPAPVDEPPAPPAAE